MTQIAGSELTNIGISVSRFEGVTDAFNRGLVTIHLPVASNKKLSAHFEAFLLRFWRPNLSSEGDFKRSDCVGKLEEKKAGFDLQVRFYQLFGQR